MPLIQQDMRRFLFSMLVFVPSCVLSLSLPNAQAETREAIVRQAGALHRVWMMMIDDIVAQRLPSGVGRIAMLGRAGRRDCDVNLYVNTQTTYVVLIVGTEYREEFYIDHPSQGFKAVLFQDRIVDGRRTAIEVEHQRRAYRIARDHKTLTVFSRRGEYAGSVCRFDVAEAQYYDGETE